MKSLSELRIVLGGLQQQLNECVGYVDQLSGLMWGGKPRKQYTKRVNGETPALPTNLREQVKAHYQAKRGSLPKHDGRRNNAGSAIPSPKNSHTITIQEAADMLHMSDSGFRTWIAKRNLPTAVETRKTHTLRGPHDVMVVRRAMVEALARGEETPIRGKATLKTVPPQRAKPRPKGQSHIAEQRQRTFDMLAHYNSDTANYVKDHGHLYGPLVRRGYLRKHGEGYLRTNLVYTVQPPAKSSGGKKKR